MTKEEISSKYADVKHVLDEAISESKAIQLSGEDENKELRKIVGSLEAINQEFKVEIDKLENSSEWDKFCVAFFGETNAGKSTIIDSLRIIFDEEQRRADILKQEKEYVAQLSSHCNDYSELLQKIKEVNNTLAVPPKKPNYFLRTLIGIGIALVGGVIGYFISFFGII